MFLLAILIGSASAGYAPWGQNSGPPNWGYDPWRGTVPTSSPNNSGTTQGVYPQDPYCLKVGGVCTDQLGCTGAGGQLSSTNQECPSSPSTIRCCRSGTASTFPQDEACKAIGGVCTDQQSCTAIWRVLNPTNQECPSSPENIRCCLTPSIPAYPQDPTCAALGGVCTDQRRCTALGRVLSPTNAECTSTPETVRCCRRLPNYTQDAACTAQGGLCTDQGQCTAMGGQLNPTNAECPSTTADARCCRFPVTTAYVQDPQCVALNGFCSGAGPCLAVGGVQLTTNAECPSSPGTIRCCLMRNTTTTTTTSYREPSKPSWFQGWGPIIGWE